MLAPERIAAILAKSRTAPCIESLGLEALEFDEGFCKLRARHDPRFDGVLRGFHGGMMAAVADCAAWFAIVTQTGPDEVMLTTDLQMRYLRPCLSDLTASARVIKLGRTLCPVQVDMHDAAGEQIATGFVTYIRINTR
jgi:uncharacterized protein (TIGR00369 family)